MNNIDKCKEYFKSVNKQLNTLVCSEISELVNAGLNWKKLPLATLENIKLISNHITLDFIDSGQGFYCIGISCPARSIYLWPDGTKPTGNPERYINGQISEGKFWIASEITNAE